MFESPVLTIVLSGAIVLVALSILIFPGFFYSVVERFFRKPPQVPVYPQTWTPTAKAHAVDSTKDGTVRIQRSRKTWT